MVNIKFGKKRGRPIKLKSTFLKVIAAAALLTLLMGPYGLLSTSILSSNSILVSESIIPTTRSSHEVLKAAIKKESGNGWKIVDWKTPFTKEEEEKFSCDFIPFESASTNRTADICVFPFKDIVSDIMRDRKRWIDCDILPSMWNASMPDENSVYVEIGANIGSCVMEMLLGTNASIIAFEPHPMNLFNMKKSVSKLDPSYQDRIKLIPIGLGSEESEPTIFSATGNMGNSIVGKVIKDWKPQKFDEKLQFTIHVERLDSILNSDIDVRLMKLDAQGFECKILEGMGSNLARSVYALKFEWEKTFLVGHDCVTNLIPSIHAYGFDIFSDFKDGKFIDGPQPESRIDFGGPKAKELFAKRDILS